MPSNENKTKNQSKMYAVDEKMQILAEFDTHMGTWVDLAPMLGL